MDGRQSPVVDERGRGRIGRYRLAGRIATGGMADVYLAVAGELTGFRTLVVVKRVLPHLASDRDFIRMFLDEARLATLLDHPNIARVIEIGRDGRDHFLAIEAVHGPPLSAVLNRTIRTGPLFSQAEIAFIIAQAAQGLGYAHRLTDVAGQPLNVVHRDVSPQNLLVSFEGTVKVIDFGVARALGQMSRTRPGHLKGKLAYMSPEQVAGGHVDRRSDLFSLGVVLWELLCGERLFARNSDAEILQAIVDGPIAAPSRLVTIPSALEDIVMRALEKDPARRFESAEPLALALDRFAFATAGFDPMRIGSMMRKLFASDYRQWKDRSAAALALKSQPAGWSDEDGTVTRERPIHRPTPRAVRIPLVLPLPPPRPRAGVGALSRHEAEGVSSTPVGASAQVRTGRVAVVMGAVAVVCLGVVGMAAAHWRQQMLAAAGQDPTAGRPAEAIVIANTQTQASAAASIPAAPTLITSAESGEHLSSVRPQPSPLTTVPVAVQPRFPNRETPSRTRVRRHRGTAPTTRADKSARAPCAIMVGTQPWSEVWIDGKDTNRHTPYWEAISCGLHQVTFKRQDLGLTRTIALTVHPGETIRRTVDLAR